MTDYPWFKNFDPGVPRTIGTYPAGTLLDAVDEGIRVVRRPGQAAIEQDLRTWCNVKAPA